MDTSMILAELRAERDRIERAIVAIGVLNSTGRRMVRRAARKTASRMSSAARRKLSLLMKQRWAQGKMKARAGAKPTQTSKPARRVTAAARRRMAAAQRARWTRVRAQQHPQKKAA